MQISREVRVYVFFTLEVTLRKLNLEQQKQLNDHVFKAQAGMVTEIFDAGVYALRHCIVDIKGLKNADLKDYKIEKNEDGFLTDECIEDLFSLPISQQLTSLVLQTATRTPDFIQDEKGKQIEEISLRKS